MDENMVTHFAQRHLLALVFAAIVALLYGGPHLFHVYQLGIEQYQPITLADDIDPAYVYFPRAKAAYQGQRVVGDINVEEYEGSPAFMPLLNPVIMGTLGRAFGSMKRGVIASDLFFPAIIFLLFYFFIFSFTQRKFFSLFISIVFIFTLDAPFWGLRQLMKPPIVSFPFARFDFPKITYLYYLPAVLFTYYALTKKRAWFVALAGIFAGMLFYTDLYDWVTFYTGIGFLILFLLLQRDWARARRVVSVLVIGLVFSTLYWMNFYALTHLPQYQDIIMRVGVEFSHGIRFFTWQLYLRVALVVAGLYFFMYKKDRLATLYLIAFLLPIFATLNLQVLTGVNPQPDHWARPLIPFMYIALSMIAMSMYGRYLRSIPKMIPFVGGIVFLILFFSVEVLYVLRFARQTTPHHSVFVDATTPLYTMPYDRAASYRWIQDNLPNTVTIGALSPETNIDLQIYTNNTLFLPFGLNTIASNEEIWQRFFYLVALYDVPMDTVQELFTKEGEEMSLYLFHNGFYRDDLNSYFQESNRRVPEHLLEDRMKKYAKIDTSNPPFQLAYVYYGPYERMLGNDPSIQNLNLEVAYEDVNVVIYKNIQ